MTVRDGLRQAERTLAEAGVAAPALDAERLLRHVLGCDRAQLLAHPERRLGAAERERYVELVARRAGREPLQHIVGEQEFWRHSFRVGPGALIPRPETELLVELALERLAPLPGPVAIDVGTGTGCIALSIAACHPGVRVHAVDVSADALALAAQNQLRLGLERQVALHRGDLLDPVAGVEADLIVSNPPYIGLDERPGLEPEVREHEPATALFPGEDRYAIYRRLVPAAAAQLREGGRLLLEVGHGMAAEVGRLCSEAGLSEVSSHPDLAGMARAVSARRAERAP